MENKIVFGRWEAVTLIINLVCTKVFLNFPRTSTEIAGTASWLLAAYISLLAFIFFFVISSLYRGHEGKDLLDISSEIAGGAGRVITGLILISFFIYITSIILREFSEDMKVIAFTNSPISYIALFFLISMMIGAYLGIEAIVRLHAITVPVIAFLYLIIIAAVLPFADFTNVFPILGNGVYNIFGKGFFRVSNFSELLVLFMIAPFIRTNNNLKKSGYISLGFSAFFMILSTPVYVATLGYPSSLENFLPIYQMARLINYGRFFQRIEPLFIVIWVTAALLYLASCFFFTVYIIKKTFRLEYHKPLIIPLSVIILTISLIPPNLVTSVRLETDYFRNVSWLAAFLFPIILLLISKVAGRIRKGENHENL